MSATGRGTKREANDYYRTPLEPIRIFLTEFLAVEPTALSGKVVDPCAGGDVSHPASYPEVLSELGVFPITMDVRSDSRAKYIKNYLTTPLPPKVQCFISNPPFNLALEFVKKALSEVVDGGFVIMLLRLNFFESAKRKEFFDEFPAKYAFVHSGRISFNGTKSTDSVAYMHCVWQRGYAGFTQLKVI